MASIVDDRGFNQGFAWNPTQEARMRRRAEAINAELGAADQKVLEWGCGTGELAHFLAERAGARVTGADLCGPFIDEANRRFRTEQLRFVQSNLATEEGRAALGRDWDAVVGNGILHHLYHHMQPALASMRSMLRPGGRLVFWEPNLFNPYVFLTFSIAPLRKLTKLEPDEMAFTPRWIRKHLAQAGFERIEVSFRDFLVPNLPFSLVPLVTTVGAVAEQLPGVNRLAQSLFITAVKSA